MRKLIAIAALTLAVVGCSGQAEAPIPSPVAATSPGATASGVPAAGAGAASRPSPKASPSQSPISALIPARAAGEGVLLDLQSAADKYTISLVAVDGIVKRQLSAAQRTPIATAVGHAVDLPHVSTSSSTLYFLAGDSSVSALATDGTTAVVARLPVEASQEATFAVTPDNSRIAIGVLDFGRSPVHVSLYTDALGGGDRKLIFESDTDYVWPVAWHQGLLVLAHAGGPYQEDLERSGAGLSNPYSAISYHLVDPATADRQVLMGQCTVSGPLTAAGTSCIQGESLGWDGAPQIWGKDLWGDISSPASISPDGAMTAAIEPGDGTRMGFYRPGGTLSTWVDGPDRRYWAGWLDATHVLMPAAAGGASKIIELLPGPAPVIPVAASGIFVARLPTDVL